MVNDSPDWNDPGHGPLSSDDERVGGLVGTIGGAAIGREIGGPVGMVAGAAVGWGLGEEVVDYVNGVNQD